MRRKIKWGLVLILLLANVFIYARDKNNRAGNLFTLAALDIGQGDALYLEDGVGHQILVDGGPGSAILSALPEVMPFGDRSLDMLILSHPHADHLDGLVEVIKRYEVGQVLEAGAAYDSAVYREWRRLLQEKKIPVTFARRGQQIKLAHNVSLDILAPFADWSGRETAEIHDSMVVARVGTASTSLALLTGDMETDLEADLIAAGDNLQSTILKVGHHGSKTSTSQSFLQKVRPVWAVISVGEKNRYRHPYPATLTNLETFGAKILRTDEKGTITFRFLPTGVDLQTER